MAAWNAATLKIKTLEAEIGTTKDDKAIEVRKTQWALQLAGVA